MSKPTILLTGGTGFVGSYLATEFLKRGYPTIFLMRSLHEEPLQHIAQQLALVDSHHASQLVQKVDFVTGDVTRPNLGLTETAIRRLRQEVRKVVHCAAAVSFDASRHDEIMTANVDGTRHILEFMRCLPQTELHYVSTAYVAGARTGLVREDELDCGQTFHNVYEASKFRAEQLVHEAARRGLQTSIYRPSILVGDSRNGQTFNFFGFYGLIRTIHVFSTNFRDDLNHTGKRAVSAGVFEHKGYLHLPIRVRALPTKTLNFIPIDYAVEVMARLFEHSRALGRTFHIVHPQPPMIDHLRQWICKALKIQGITVVDDDAFVAQSPTMWESLFAACIKDYQPYLDQPEARFDDANVRTLLGKPPTPPPVTADLVHRFVQYCMKTDWGRRLS